MGIQDLHHGRLHQVGASVQVVEEGAAEMKEGEFAHLPPEVREKIAQYDDDLASGTMTFDGKGGIIPDSPEAPGWMTFLASQLPEMDVHRR